MIAFIDNSKTNGFICNDDGDIIATMGIKYDPSCYGPGLAETEELKMCDVSEITPNHFYNIQFIRKYYNLTQKELAEITGIPKRTIENWEEGSRIAPIYITNLIETYLEVRIKR